MKRTFICSVCGLRHAGLPDLAFIRPDDWLRLSPAIRKRGFESDEACIIRPRRGPIRCFIRGVLEIPILAPGRTPPLGYGPWAEVGFDALDAVITGKPAC